MPKREGALYDQARELFEEFTPRGARRCQAFSKQKLAAIEESTPEPSPSKIAEGQCGNAATLGSLVCHMHGVGKKGGRPGGRPPVTGRYSRRLPADLRVRYEAALEDPALIELRDEMGVITTLLGELLIQFGEHPPNFEEMNDVLETLGEALRAEDTVEAQLEFLRLLEVVASGKGQWALLKEIRLFVEAQRKLAATEVTRLTALKQMITVEQAMAFLQAVKAALQDHFRALRQTPCPHCNRLPPETHVTILQAQVGAQLRELAERRTKPVTIQAGDRS